VNAIVDGFDRMVAEFQRPLFLYARRMIGNHEDAEEIVQDTFFRAYRALLRMAPETRVRLHLKAWLYTITLNLTRNRLRKRQPVFVPLDASRDPDALIGQSAARPATPDTFVERAADVELVERALREVPALLRPAARMRFIEDRGQMEIAQYFSQPVGTVKSHVHRASRILRRALSAELVSA
jgi:RNA polymerase sigma-70 factor (ECF subfamily)